MVTSKVEHDPGESESPPDLDHSGGRHCGQAIDHKPAFWTASIVAERHNLMTWMFDDIYVDMNYRNRFDSRGECVDAVLRSIQTGSAGRALAAPRLVSDDATYSGN